MVNAMQANPFQIARWALFASFALMVLVVCLPDPQPSPAWELAQQERYEERFPQLKTPASPNREPALQFADDQPKAAPPQPKMAQEPPTRPLRTAHLPERSPTGDQRANAVRMGQPLFFPEDQPSSRNLAPDPVHLEPPQISQ